MADAIFAGLKLAFKAYNAYEECKAELGEFQDDYDELSFRLKALQPVLDGLANRLDDSLSMTLELAKSEQEKANKYTEELLAYTRRFKGHAPHFAAIAGALASKAISTLPGPLQEVGNALLPVIKKHGVPEKAYAKFADKLHFLMSALSATAATQLVKQSAMDRGVEMIPSPKTVAAVDGSYTPVSTTEVVPVVDTVQLAPTTVGAETKVLVTAVVDAESKLKAILEENIAEADEPFRAILIGTRSIPYTLVFGLWMDGKPHLMTVTFFGMVPATMRIITAPSTDFILELQKNPKRIKNDLGTVRKQCKATPGAVDKRKNHDMVLMGLIPYVGACCNLSVVCCNCLWTRLTMDGMKVDGKKFTVKINNKKILINDTLVFEPNDLPVNVGAMICSCFCSGPMTWEMCC